MTIQPQPHPPSWLPHLTTPAATTHLTPQLFSGTCPHQHGTWTTIPSNHPLPRQSQSTASQRSNPSPSNTARLMLPSVETPSAYSTGKECPATPTRQSTPLHQRTMSSPPSL